MADCGGVVRPFFVSPGEIDACFCFGLLAVRGLDLALVDCAASPGLSLACFCGVKGSWETRSRAKEMSVGMSFSEAYVLWAGELP